MNVFSKSLKGIKINRKLPWMSLLCIMALIAGLTASQTWASSRNKRHAQVNEEEAQPPSYMKADITIQQKSLQHVFTYGKDFAVNSETVIVGANGKEVKLKKMLVPCDAEVLYLIENGEPTAKRINIKRVASDANWQWVSEKPE